jgi:hypothetical protein
VTGCLPSVAPPGSAAVVTLSSFHQRVLAKPGIFRQWPKFAKGGWCYPEPRA